MEDTFYCNFSHKNIPSDTHQDCLGQVGSKATRLCFAENKGERIDFQGRQLFQNCFFLSLKSGLL